MKIMIIGLNYAPEPIGIAVYTTGMAEELVARGHQVSVICGQPYYPAWKLMNGYKQGYHESQENGVNILRCPHYIPAKPSGLKRILHHMSFSISAMRPAFKRARKTKPDIVFTIAPSIISAPVGLWSALQCKAKKWLHIQDFEVEAAFATGLIKSRTGRRLRMSGWIEKKLFSYFDIISTIAPAMCEKLAFKGIPLNKIIEFRNWGDVTAIQPLAQPSTYRKEWNITAPHVAFYSGNIANKQGIEIIVEAAALLHERKDLTFIVCGEGPQLSALKTKAAGLSNIRFYPLQPIERLNELLGLASVHLLPQSAGAADLLLPSKLINMLASGRPVIATAEPGSALAEEIQSCGLICKPGKPDQFAQTIITLLDEPHQHAIMSAAARQRAIDVWEKEKIIDWLETSMLSLVQSGK